ncbi:GntR family transcriptional regulator [Mycolicibacterium sp. CH28]|uniref:GntR family transcriptional regulator n=1 Tax=Mycolicibacterium sp. CH28 TaxID=2512237 RepID=UPI0010805ACF|nr:GntR family transcriptional regulator [Mycolicibacterium sp. CH28]TGD87872.1 GntR family transcriptional regulator [Mycolicibacterium sp. CH28]
MTAAGVGRTSQATALEQAYDAILEAILEGEIPAGAPLRLQELSTTFGMSMMPIREALRQLESIGVVEVIPRKGARVREISADDLIDTYRTRILLEGALCRRAAENFDTSDEVAARAALERQRLALLDGDAGEARLAHKDFHYSIYRAAGSEWMLRSIESTWHNSERYRIASEQEGDQLTLRRKEHEQMLRACVRHRPDEARLALRAHLISTVAHLDKSLAKRLDILTAGDCC